ncbi:unnamed protein product [Adineta steineri]|uniref:Uncharacterized protein n=1 Tax=Adineta steineri TaxID=433720 RepID=A0A819NLK9_9BILA|nr:unnamed protein product [Adineta steineri]CAF3995300.1 unnamed protein product [Adineta steineri]
MINIPDTSNSLSSKRAVTVNAYQIDENKSTRKKHYKRSRRQVASQQQSMIDKPSHVAGKSSEEFSMN